MYACSATFALGGSAESVRDNLQGVRESLSQWLKVNPPVVEISRVEDTPGGGATVGWRLSTVYSDSAYAIQGTIQARKSRGHLL